MLIIDGSKFEGGGQILRTALALSLVTGKRFKIKGIRKSRKKPGLKNQHIACINSILKLSESKVDNLEEGSLELTFEPSVLKGGNLNIDMGTAGSITLLFQGIILPLLFTKKRTKINVIGGTDVKWSPPADYFANIFLPQIRKFTEKINFEIKRRGYYPKGGGEVYLQIVPKKYGNPEDARKERRIELTYKGKLMQIKGVSHASRSLFKQEVAERQTKRATLSLSHLKCPVSIRNEYSETSSKGSGLILWAKSGIDEIDLFNPLVQGGDSLGEKDKKAKTVTEEAVQSLMENMKAPVDIFLADQLIPFIAIFGGQIKTREISQHSRANAYVCNEFLGNVVDIDEKEKIIRSNF